MLRFYAEAFAGLMVMLERARSLGRFDQRTFDLLVEHLQRLPVPKSIISQAERLRDIESWSPQDRSRAIENFEADLAEELGEHEFLCVPSGDKRLFNLPEEWFGKDVVAAFPDARRDMREAGKCLALSRWSAAVFHAMGIMEHGLRALGKRVGVSLSPTIDLQNWHIIIEQIESQIKKWKQLPRDQQDQPEIEFCSRAASHFFAVKEAWRNHVSHARGRYDDEEARKVVGNVRDFMRVLA